MSLRNQILCVYIPLLIVSIALTLAYISSALRQNQRQEAYYQLENSADVMRILLEDRLENILASFVTVEDSDAFSQMMLNQRYNKDDTNYSDLIGMGNLLDDTYGKYFNIIDSIYININDLEFTLMKRHSPLYRSVDVLSMYQESANGVSARYLWQAPHPDTVFYKTDRQVFSVEKFYGAPGESVFGLFLMNVRTDYILDLFDNMPVSEHGYWLLVADGNVFTQDGADSTSALPEGAVDFLLQYQGSQGHFESRSASGEALYVFFNGIGTNGWGIATVLPQDELVYNTDPLDFRSLGVSILILGAMIGFAILFAHGISHSLCELSKRVEFFERAGIETRQPDVKFHIGGTREVALLSDALDHMALTIRSLVARILQKQDQLRRQELNALQEQIKPHFVYNALSTVLYEIDGGKNAEASEMLRALITFFRLGVNHGSEIVTVGDEIAHVTSYLRIQHARQDYDFRVEVHADEDLLKNEIQKFTLQPLAENCLVHGFGSAATRPDEPYICISVTQDGDRVILEVMDNGAGISLNDLERLRNEINTEYTQASDLTYGLRNVNLRIRLRYGAEYGVSVESIPGQCTTFRVCIPLKNYTPRKTDLPEPVG
jgi:two-component system sensor histidine kinase YesM